MRAVLQAGVAADAPAIAGILSAWIDETHWMPRLHGPSSYLGFAEILLAASTVSVALKNGVVVGFLARKGADIQALYLAPGARGLGIGAALLGGAKGQVDRLGLWTFQANAGALRFYRQQGFAEDQRTDGAGNDEKLPDVHMIWGATDG